MAFQQRGSRAPNKAVALILAFFLAAGVGGVLLAGVALPLAAAAGTAANAATEIFNDLPEDIDPTRPSEISTIYYADGSVMTHFWYQNRISVPIEQISDNMQQAIVAIEDRRFYDHNGIDVEGMARALISNAQGGDTQGASTLTQQYVKNVFVERASQVELIDPVQAQELYDRATAQSYGRKLQEARYAIQLEKRYTKEEILEGYLNLAQFGPSVYGVEAASIRYFNHPASQLTVAESALLAGIPQSPNNLDPIRNPKNAKARQTVVLNAMLREGYITEAEHRIASATTIEEMIVVGENNNARSGCEVAGISAYFCAYVVRELYTNPAYADFLGETVFERQRTLLAGGLQITTTLDPKIQQAAFDAIVANVPVNDPSGVNIALSSIEPGTGKIQAMVQNTNFGKNPTEEDPEQTEVNYNVGVSHGGGQGFQTGSAFKVFTITEWVRNNMALQQMVPAQQRIYPADTWTISCAPEYRATASVKNIEGTWGSSAISVLEATKRSINLPFMWMANQMDMCGIIGVAEAMGVERGNGEPLELYPSSVLGTNTNTPLSMANAFATLANDGTKCEPVAVTGLTNLQGEEFTVPESECEEVISPEVARTVTYALSRVTERGGTGFRADMPGRPEAGKTGTANMDTHAWFVGYTPQLSAAIWTGHSEADISMFYSTINGVYHEEVYGGLLAAPSWRLFMTAALDGKPVENFIAPKPTSVAGFQIPIPYVVGRSPADATKLLETAGFAVEISADEVNSDIPVGAVAEQSPAGQAVAGSRITLTISKGPAPAPPAEPAEPTAPPTDPGTNNGGNTGSNG